MPSLGSSPAKTRYEVVAWYVMLGSVAFVNGLSDGSCVFTLGSWEAGCSTFLVIRRRIVLLAGFAGRMTGEKGMSDMLKALVRVRREHPGANLAGSVETDEAAFQGIGCAGIPKASLGASATVGGGAVAVRDVELGATVKGVSAR